jgi:hypothetical protein
VETERFGRVSVLFFVDFIRLGNSIQYSGRNRCSSFLFLIIILWEDEGGPLQEILISIDSKLKHRIHL